jgi:hypothetical protein
MSDMCVCVFGLLWNIFSSFSSININFMLRKDVMRIFSEMLNNNISEHYFQADIINDTTIICGYKYKPNGMVWPLCYLHLAGGDMKERIINSSFVELIKRPVFLDLLFNKQQVIQPPSKVFVKVAPVLKAFSHPTYPKSIYPKLYKLVQEMEALFDTFCFNNGFEYEWIEC